MYSITPRPVGQAASARPKWDSVVVRFEACWGDEDVVDNALGSARSVVPVVFIATQFAVTRENGLLITALGAPSTDGEDLYLTLQHQQEHDEQDVALGMITPHIEFCGQGWSWYGHILEFTLHRQRIEVRMDAEAAAEMQNDGHLQVRFNLDDLAFLELRSALHETFANREYFRDKA